jgi:hypothetical protein
MTTSILAGIAALMILEASIGSRVIAEQSRNPVREIVFPPRRPEEPALKIIYRYAFRRRSIAETSSILERLIDGVDPHDLLAPVTHRRR